MNVKKKAIIMSIKMRRSSGSEPEVGSHKVSAPHEIIYLIFTFLIIVHEILYHIISLFTLKSVKISKQKTIRNQNVIKNDHQKSRAWFFTTLHSNKLKPKITDRFCDLLELKLKKSWS